MLLIVILNQGGPYGDREEIRTSGLDRTSEVREEREFGCLHRSLLVVRA